MDKIVKKIFNSVSVPLMKEIKIDTKNKIKRNVCYKLSTLCKDLMGGVTNEYKYKTAENLLTLLMKSERIQVEIHEIENPDCIYICINGNSKYKQNFELFVKKVKEFRDVQ